MHANKSKSSRQTNVQEHVDFIPSVQAAQHSTRPPLSYAQQLLGTHYQHWEAADGLNLLPTYGMDVPTMQIYAPRLQPTQDAVVGACDESALNVGLLAGISTLNAKLGFLLCRPSWALYVGRLVGLSMLNARLGSLRWTPGWALDVECQAGLSTLDS
ncbi:hypothetical protein Fot_03338 [Forsythia ovata]|uniref:Uncharacterized protein n=1 Tax=Forsythia ovata TaxID=205694 RepID=A0ABD1X9G5_9LAMI